MPFILCKTYYREYARDLVSHMHAVTSGENPLVYSSFLVCLKDFCVVGLSIMLSETMNKLFEH